MIQLKNVSKRYDSTAVLQNFTLDFKPGITAILAPTGSGKTTLLRLIAGLEPCDDGEILMTGKTSFMFQEDRLLPTLTAQQNVELVLQEESFKASCWLDKLGLEKSKNSFPDELSGGMRRRVALARALSYEAEILLLDEPFKGLDIENKNNIMRDVVYTAAERTAILVTHDIWEAAYCAEDIIVATGPPFNIKHKVRNDLEYSKRGAENLVMKSLQNRLTQLIRS